MELTERQKQVKELRARGDSFKQVANALGISCVAARKSHHLAMKKLAKGNKVAA